MARYPAIAATGQALVALLTGAATGTEFDGVTFKLASSADVQKPAGESPVATLYLYRVAVNTTRRNLPPRRHPDGLLRMPPVPVDLHYLVTAWSRDPVTQHRLLGWCIRTLQDNPIVPAGYLNQFGPDQDLFGPDESIELTWEVLSRQDMTDAWEVAKSNQQPSVSYVARILRIESDVEVAEHAPVQTIQVDYLLPVGP